MTAAWKINATSTDKLVLLALADWANGEGLCWPSIKQLADKSGLAERGLQMAIKRLCEAGHLTRCEVTGKGVNYTVHPRTTCTPAKDAPPHEMTQTPARRAPNTVSNHQESKKATPSHSKRERSKPALTAFAEFWALYPRKVGKAKAEQAWPKACNRQPEAFIIAAARRYAADPPDDPQFIPHPATWLNQARFEDEPDEKRPLDSRPGKPAPQYRRSHGLDMLRELRAEIEADEGAQGVHHGAILALPLPARH